MSAAAVSQLFALAEVLAREGYPLQAMRCYEAIFVEIEARLRLARLLLAFTHNLREAKNHLERANLLARTRLSVRHIERVQVLFEVARCYRFMGSAKMEEDKLQEAIKIALREPKGSPARADWLCTLHLSLSAVHASQKGVKAARNALDRLDGYIKEAKDRPDLRAVAVIHRLQMECVAGEDPDALRPLFQLCDTAIDDARALAGAPPALTEHITYRDDLPLLAQQLELHAVALKALYALRCGASPDALGATPAALAGAVQRAGEFARLTQGREPPYAWLPAPAIVALLTMLDAHQRRVDPQQAGKVVGDLEGVVLMLARSLDEAGVDVAVGKAHNEDSVPAAVKMGDAGALLSMFCLVLEGTCLAKLARVDIDGAQGYVVQLLDLLQRFPKTLARFQPTCHVLCGLYAHATEEYPAAAAQFRLAAAAARDEEGVSVATSFAAIAALCGVAVQRKRRVANSSDDELDADADPTTPPGRRISGLPPTPAETLDDAIETLGSLQERCLTLKGPRGRAAAIFATAAVRLRQGKFDGARKLLKQVLKLAEQTADNHLMCSALNMMAPAAEGAGRDFTALSDFADNAFAQAYKSKNLPAELAALDVLIACERDDAERAKKEQHRAKRFRELTTCIETAKADVKRHRAVLGFK
ncbi:unnamed protein product [Pedinophyceae sp. YPF-701]|nr:unnamed protein product [Pedinophyceae sp. YPF-701]